MKKNIVAQRQYYKCGNCGACYPQNQYVIAWWGRSDFAADKLVRRRLDNRIPLINPPEFKLKKSDLPESDVKTTVYKIPVCCSCGGSDATKLEESEQFEVESSKGNRYIMRFHCNNPKCGYYW